MRGLVIDVANETQTLRELTDSFVAQRTWLENGRNGEKPGGQSVSRVRQRVTQLIDLGSPLFEIGLWVGHDLETGDQSPASRVVVGIGQIHGRDHLVIANDPDIQAGALSPATAKKILRGQQLALENRLPVVYLVDSVGLTLPLESDLFADEDDPSRIDLNAVFLREQGIHQTCVVLGLAVDGGFWPPGDVVICNEQATLLTSENEELRPRWTDSASENNVRIDAWGADAEACLQLARERIAAGAAPTGLSAPVFSCHESIPPVNSGEALLGILDSDARREYDMRDLLACVVDRDTFCEFKSQYGQTLVCGTARVGGYSVGIVANQHHRVRNSEGEYQFGGVIYVDSAEKAARFVLTCNQEWLPILFIQDVNGFMIGRDSERAGIIKAGAKLVNAVCNSRVPKVTLLVGGSYGAGNYALCGRACDPRFMLAWPNARFAVMGSEQATSTLVDVNARSLKRQGEAINDERIAALRATVEQGYQRQADIRYAASRGWVDAIIHPAQTRDALLRCLEVVTRAVHQEPWRVGVFQT